MPEAKLFMLDVKADHENRAVSLRLSDENNQPLGTNDVRLDSHPASTWEGLFDTAAHVHRHARGFRPASEGDSAAAAASELVEQLGVFLGKEVMGSDIIGAIAAGDDRRTLLVRFPAAGSDPLTASFTAVPWHIARSALGVRPLVERNVVVRVVPPSWRPRTSGPIALRREPGEALRVLLVFTEAPGARPLAARLERERLRELFYDEIMPDRQVMLDILCHGVSREMLRQKLQDAGGYHIIHWSGYGHDPLSAPLGSSLESDDATSLLYGHDLAELIAEAGGFVPELVFLGAADAGPLGRIESWDALQATVRDMEPSPDQRGRPSLPDLIDRRYGCSEIALELARAGVPQIVAMRHPAGSAYARRLARRFYRSLLAVAAPHPADSALALAQRDLLADPRTGDYHPADHAAAIVLGASGLRFELDKGASPDLELRRPQPQPLLRGRADLDPPRGFAGRGNELSTLAARWVPKQGAAVALMHGPEGFGKTALAAEVIHLWHRQFHWVIAFQLGAEGLSLDDFYREIDKRLMRASPAYRERCKENEERRVYLPARQDLTGPERYELLRDNLIDVLSTASLLIVLDGFESNVGAIPVEDGYLCSDPEWDVLLNTLVERLADISGSRVLVTSRFPVASLPASREVVSIDLGPLLANEALSMVEGAESLAGLLRGGVMDRELAWRVLESTAGHPVALRRLSDLAREGRAALESGVGMAPPQAPPAAPPVVVPPPPSAPQGALEKLGFGDLAAGREPPRREEDEHIPPPVISMRPLARPDVEGAAPTSPAEVADRAVALLVERLSPEERNLLWRITRAPAPMKLELIKRLAELSR